MTPILSSTPPPFAQAHSRRSFLRQAGLMAALTPAAALFIKSAGQASAAYTPPLPKGTALDIAILNFALNLEYLEGEYYTRGSTGATLTDFGIPIDGAGTQGDVVAKSNPLVPFTSAIHEQYMLEIAQDEMRHILFIRSVITGLGGTPVARPAINFTDTFSAVSANAGLGPNFDPFADETSFFLGADSLTDVGVTAYNGSATLITTPAVLQGASGLLAVEAYHAATLRATIFAAGVDAQYKQTRVTTLQDYVDDNGTTTKGEPVVNSDGSPNIVPADNNSIAFYRDPRSVLNIVYTANGAPYGGFFPNGLNGIIT